MKAKRRSQSRPWEMCSKPTSALVAGAAISLKATGVFIVGTAVGVDHPVMQALFREDVKLTFLRAD